MTAELTYFSISSYLIFNFFFHSSHPGNITAVFTSKTVGEDLAKMLDEDKGNVFVSISPEPPKIDEMNNVSKDSEVVEKHSEGLNDDLKNRVKRLETESSALKSKVKHLEIEKDDLKNRLNRFEIKNNNLTDKIEHLEIESIDLRERVERLEIANDVIQIENQHLKDEKYDKLKEEVEELKVRLGEN